MHEGSILTGAIALVAICGGAVAYFGKSRGDSIIKYQAQEIQLRDGTITRLEKDNAALQSENKVLKDQNTKLSELAQGSPQLKSLTKAVEALVSTVKDKLEGTGNARGARSQKTT